MLTFSALYQLSGSIFPRSFPWIAGHLGRDRRSL